MKRRDFLHTSASSIAGLSAITAMNAFGQLAEDNKFRKEIGIQLYTLRNEIKKDVGKTIKAVADAGYKQVEAYNFPKAGDMIKAAKDNGLAVHSSHFAWESVTDPEKKGVTPFAEILEKAKGAGLSHLVVPYLHGHNRKTLDDYKRLAERCNKAAKEAKKAGIQLAYHNHAFEFEAKDGGNGFDIFIDEFEPEMQFEVDVFWVKIANVDPVEMIKKLKGRVSQLHLKDLKLGSELPQYGGVAKDAFQELGDGMIPMEPILKVAGETGVQHCHVEQDHSPDPIASVQQSLNYLKTL